MSILNDIPILTILLIIPLVGMLLVLLLPKQRSNWIRIAAVAAASITLILTILLYGGFDKQQGGEGFGEEHSWVSIPLNKEPQQGVTDYLFTLDYSLAVDGFSLPLILLTALITAMAALAAVHVKKRNKAFYAWLLLLETGMLGVFLARDIFMFFIGFELTLIATYFLIGIWGSYNRERAANEFLIYNGIGSAIMLLAFIILASTAGFRIEQTASGLQYIYSGSYDVILQNIIDPMAWVNLSPELTGTINPFYMSDTMQWTLFIMLLIAFGIKLPIIPFHTWMLRVHAEAAPSVVMLHSGVMLKMGAYGLLKFGVLLFPQQAHQWAAVIAALGLVNLLYGAVLALRQTDLRLVLAYSSISHMGFVLLGIAAFNELGLQGAMVQLVSHGLISALLFLILGSLHERTGTTELEELGGLARSMPFMSGMLLAAGLASLGLPGLSGFVGELLTLLGLFESMKWIAAAALLGVILAAAYMLRAVLKITFGPMNERFAALRDARLIEAIPIIILFAFIVLIGCFPSVLTDTIGRDFAGLYEFLLAEAGGGR